MSDGYRILSAFVLWFVIGFAVTGLAARRHPDWYLDGISHPSRDNGAVMFSVLLWPIPVLLYVANEVMPAEEASR